MWQKVSGLLKSSIIKRERERKKIPCWSNEGQQFEKNVYWGLRKWERCEMLLAIETLKLHQHTHEKRKGGNLAEKIKPSEEGTELKVVWQFKLEIL